MAATSHPKPGMLERFMREELGRAEVAGLVRHLLTGCPQCVEVTRRLWNLGERSRALEILLRAGKAMESRSSGRRPGRPRANLY